MPPTPALVPKHTQNHLTQVFSALAIVSSTGAALRYTALRRAAAVPEHFGTVLDNLVGPRNIRPLIEARRAYVKAHPRPELPPPPCQEQLLLDRQLMEMYAVLSQKR